MGVKKYMEALQVEKKNGNVLVQILRGALVGLGAVLPGVSGGVLCVIFGLYQMIMEVLADPFHGIKKHIRTLIPVGIGIILGFLGISRILGFLLNEYPGPSVSLFAGVILGMMPSLFREAGLEGRDKKSYISMGTAFVVLLVFLGWIQTVSAQIVPNFGWYLFCGVCLAMSVIVPGLSFSTLLMPLGLYTPLLDGIGHFQLEVLIPAGLAGLLTAVLLANAIKKLFEKHYSVLFHALVGIVAAATLVIIPWMAMGWIEILCLAGGIVVGYILDRVQMKVDKE